MQPGASETGSAHSKARGAAPGRLSSLAQLPRVRQQLPQVADLGLLATPRPSQVLYRGPDPVSDLRVLAAPTIQAEGLVLVVHLVIVVGIQRRSAHDARRVRNPIPLARWSWPCLRRPEECERCPTDLRPDQQDQEFHRAQSPPKKVELQRQS